MTRFASTITCRAATHHDIAPALRLVLSSGPHRASDAQVVDFLRFSLSRGIDTSATFIAERGAEILSAILPVPSAGRTMLLLAAAHFATSDHRNAFPVLLEYVLHAYTAAGVHLAQVLLDPSEKDAFNLYREHDFQPLAELLYLQAPTRRAIHSISLPSDHFFITYSEKNHSIFAQTIAKTYNGSLDCPGLAGKRNIEDILAGHRATGDFHPDLWFLLLHHDEPLGVVLLAPAPPNDSMELVYLGLTPASRHRGLSDVLFRHALHVTHAHPLPKLMLAVDSTNTPALKLYYRNGMRRLHSKLALMRELKKEDTSQNAEVWRKTSAPGSEF